MKIDIANNIKAVELLKVELLQKVTDLFGDISADGDFETNRRIACDAGNLMNIVCLLGMRLGVEYDDIKSAMLSGLDEGIADEHILERRYGDLSRLRTEIGEGVIL